MLGLVLLEAFVVVHPFLIRLVQFLGLTFILLVRLRLGGSGAGR